MNVPDRVDFDPFPITPWLSDPHPDEALGYVKGDLDYAKVAAQVFAADQCREVMKSLGYKAPDKNSVTHASCSASRRPSIPRSRRVPERLRHQAA